MAKNIEIKFNAGIYKKVAIKGSVKAFKDTAVFKLSKQGDYYVLAISEIVSGIEQELPAEFCNYVLYLMKK